MFLWCLVIAQFLIAAALVLTTSWLPIPWWALLGSLPGIWLAIWAWITMGLLRTRIHPSTTNETRLLTNGPYAVVRHPMYAGLLWFTGAVVLAEFTWWRLVLWIILWLVLHQKAKFEEVEMAERFSDYRTYAESVPRFWIFARGRNAGPENANWPA